MAEISADVAATLALKGKPGRPIKKPASDKRSAVNPNHMRVGQVVLYVYPPQHASHNPFELVPVKFLKKTPTWYEKKYYGEPPSKLEMADRLQLGNYIIRYVDGYYLVRDAYLFSRFEHGKGNKDTQIELQNLNDFFSYLVETLEMNPFVAYGTCLSAYSERSKMHYFWCNKKSILALDAGIAAKYVNTRGHARDPDYYFEPDVRVSDTEEEREIHRLFPDSKTDGKTLDDVKETIKSLGDGAATHGGSKAFISIFSEPQNYAPEETWSKDLEAGYLTDEQWKKIEEADAALDKERVTDEEESQASDSGGSSSEEEQEVSAKFGGAKTAAPEEHSQRLLDDREADQFEEEEEDNGEHEPVFQPFNASQALVPSSDDESEIGSQDEEATGSEEEGADKRMDVDLASGKTNMKVKLKFPKAGEKRKAKAKSSKKEAKRARQAKKRAKADANNNGKKSSSSSTHSEVPPRTKAAAKAYDPAEPTHYDSQDDFVPDADAVTSKGSGSKSKGASKAATSKGKGHSTFKPPSSGGTPSTPSEEQDDDGFFSGPITAKNSLDEYQKLGYEAAQAQIKDRDTKIAVGQMWRMNRAVIGAIRGLRDKNDQFYHSVNKMYGRNGHLETLLKGVVVQNTRAGQTMAGGTKVKACLPWVSLPVCYKVLNDPERMKASFEYMFNKGLSTKQMCADFIEAAFGEKLQHRVGPRCVKRSANNEEILATCIYGQVCYEVPENLSTVYLSARQMILPQDKDSDTGKLSKAFQTALTNHRRRKCWLFNEAILLALWEKLPAGPKKDAVSLCYMDSDYRYWLIIEPFPLTSEGDIADDDACTAYCNRWAMAIKWQLKEKQGAKRSLKDTNCNYLNSSYYTFDPVDYKFDHVAKRVARLSIEGNSDARRWVGDKMIDHVLNTVFPTYAMEEPTEMDSAARVKIPGFRKKATIQEVCTTINLKNFEGEDNGV